MWSNNTDVSLPREHSASKVTVNINNIFCELIKDK